MNWYVRDSTVQSYYTFFSTQQNRLLLADKGSFNERLKIFGMLLLEKTKSDACAANSLSCHFIFLISTYLDFLFSSRLLLIETIACAIDKIHQRCIKFWCKVHGYSQTIIPYYRLKYCFQLFQLFRFVLGFLSCFSWLIVVTTDQAQIFKNIWITFLQSLKSMSTCRPSSFLKRL